MSIAKLETNESLVESETFFYVSKTKTWYVVQTQPYRPYRNTYTQRIVCLWLIKSFFTVYTSSQ